MKIGDGTLKNRSINIRKIVVYSSLNIFISYFAGCSGQVSRNFSGETMGTWYSIKYSVPSDSEVFFENNVKSGADSVLKEVNRQMSTYDPGSEISMFNKSSDTTWFDVSKEFAGVVSTSLFVSKESGGAFDVTVAPLVNLWGFGPLRKEQTIPSDKQINEIKKHVGYKFLVARLDPPALKKRIPELEIDLSSIAKGFGVDQVAEYLEKIGIKDYMVEVGGEVRTCGLNDGIPWRIGIQTPDEEEGIEAVLNLSGESVATSGDYHNYFEENGVRYSHTIDPFTGKPITHKLASISVLYGTCTVADAYATAIDVLGPTLGQKFAEKLKLSTFFIVKKDNKFAEMMTGEFGKYALKLKKDQ